MYECLLGIEIQLLDDLELRNLAYLLKDSVPKPTRNHPKCVNLYLRECETGVKRTQYTKNIYPETSRV